MFALLALTGVFIVGTILLQAYGRRREIMENWPKYRSDLMIMLTAFLYKPERDPRTRWEFAEANFREHTSSLAGATLKLILQPFLSVFHLLASTLDESMNGVENVKNITDTMAASFKAMFDVFNRRFSSLFHQLHLTYYRLNTAMERIYAASMNTVWQSLSTISAMMSTMDLMIKVAIIILIIVVAMIFFFFLFLWPFMPLVLSVIGIITAAGAGGAVGGMASTFCFGPDTPVRLAGGLLKPIRAVRLGDVLEDGGRVTAHMEFVCPAEEPLYDIRGIQVTGSHLYYDAEGVVRAAKDHPDARLWTGQRPERLYCLNTTTHTIPVAGIQFADWEELDSDDTEGLLAWNRYVFETLNPGATWDPVTAHIDAEAVLHPATYIRTPTGPVEMSHVRPGDIVLDADGRSTHVTGVVNMHPDAVTTKALWVRCMPSGKWEQSMDVLKANQTKPYISLFTASGTFLLDREGWGVQDFADVGSHRIASSYEWVLDHIRRHQ